MALIKRTSRPLGESNNLTPAEIDGNFQFVLDEIPKALGRVYTLSQYGVPNNAVLDMQSQIFGEDGTTAIQTILDKAQLGPITVIWDTKTCINTGSIPLKIYSNTTIIGRDGCGFIQANNSSCFAIVNANPVGMSNTDATKLGTIIDNNISISNLICNFNGYVGETAKQLHNVTGRGWTIGVRLAGVRNLHLDRLYGRNQRTFSFYLSNCERVNIGLLDIRCNPTTYSTGDYAGYYFGNTDGLKLHASTDVVIYKIAGRAGDDILSIVSNDGLFPYSLISGSVDFYDPYAVYGRCTNVHVHELFFDKSSAGMRLLSSDQLLDNIRVDYVHGSTQLQWLVCDNLSNNDGYELTHNGNTKQAFQGTAGNKGGVYGNISFGRVDVENTGNVSPYYSAMAYFSGSKNLPGKFDSLSFDWVSRKSNSLAGLSTILVKYLTFGYLSINGSRIVVDNSALDNPLLTTKGCNIDKLIVHNSIMDRSINSATTTGPIVVLEESSTINLFSLFNTSSKKTNFIVEQRSGVVNKLLASQIDHDGINAYYVASGSSIGTAAVSTYSGSTPFFPTVTSGVGTITTKIGDAFMTAITIASITMSATPNPFTPPANGTSPSQLAIQIVGTPNSPIVSVVYHYVDYQNNDVVINSAGATSATSFTYDWALPGPQPDLDLKLYAVATLQDNSTMTSPKIDFHIKN